MATTKTLLRTSSFANGEISNRARWKSWTEQFQTGCLYLRNFVTGDYGEISRRPGVCITDHLYMMNAKYGYACTLVDKVTGERKQFYVSQGLGGTLAVVLLDRIKKTHPDFGGLDSAGVRFSRQNGITISTANRMRHASYDGEEYFVGIGTTPFKLRLEDGTVTGSPIDFIVDPMRDLNIESKISFEAAPIAEDGTCVVDVSWDESADNPPEDFNANGLVDKTLMLVNYGAESNYSKKIKIVVGATDIEDANGTVQKAGWMSERFPAFGTVTVTTDGAYWAGKLTLRERFYSEDGERYEEKDLGSIVTSGITGQRVLTVNISSLRSEVYLYLEELYNTPDYVGSGSYADTGTTVSLTMSGAQEVFMKVKSATVVSEENSSVKHRLLCKPTNRYNDMFTTNTFAVSALMTPMYQSPVGVRTICAFQDRVVFGGTTVEPKKVWMSATGNPRDFRIGTLDSDALSVSVSGSDDEEICWMSPREALVIGTTAREYALAGSTNPAVTPTSIKVSKPNGTSAFGNADTESYNGEEGIFCLRAGGKDLLFYKYSTETYSYIPTVLNNVNLEIFGDKGAKSIAVATRPRTTVYALRNDGKIACLRYFGANGVVGWSVLELPGTVESIFTARNPESGEDELFFTIVKDGVWSQGVLVEGEYIDRIWHYNGGDYDDVKQPYVSEVHTTPWLLGESDAWGRRVNVNKTTLCLNTARAFETSLDGGKTWTPENRAFDSVTGAQKELINEEYELRARSGWRSQAELWLRTDDEHELTLNVVRAGLTLGD